MALHGELKNCKTMIEEVDTNLLTAQQKNVVRALQTNIGHYSNVFTAETSRAEVAITEAVTTVRHPQGPLVPLPGPLPSGQSLPPSSGSTKKAKSTCEHCGKEFSKLGDMKDHKRNKHPSEGDEPKPYCDTCKTSFFFKI